MDIFYGINYLELVIGLYALLILRDLAKSHFKKNTRSLTKSCFHAYSLN